MGCEALSDAGLISGFLSGFVAIFALVLDIFFNISVYNKCQDSWLYDFGFIMGLGIAAKIGLSGLRPFVTVLCLMIAGFLALMVGGFVMVGIGIGITAFAAYMIYQALH